MPRKRVQGNMSDLNFSFIFDSKKYLYSSGTFFSFYGEMMLNNRGIEQYIVTDTFLKTKMLCVPTQVQEEPAAAQMFDWLDT